MKQSWKSKGRRLLSAMIVGALILESSGSAYAVESENLTDSVENSVSTNYEAQDLTICVSSENADYFQGGDVVLDVNIQNNTDCVISDGSFWATAQGSQTGSAWFEKSEGSVINASLITGINLAPGEVCPVRYHFVISESIKNSDDQTVKFYFAGKNEDETKIYKYEDFFYAVNCSSIDTTASETKNIILSATDDDNITVTVEGSMPADSAIKLTRLNKQDLDDLKDDLADNAIKPEGIWQFGYDISVGEQNSFESPVTVTVNGFDLGYYNFDNLCVHVYHIHNAKAEVIDGVTITKEGITFQTSSFSEYYFDIDVIEEKEEVANSIAESGPEILQYLYPEQYAELANFDWDSWCNEFVIDENTATEQANTETPVQETATVNETYPSRLMGSARSGAAVELSDPQIVSEGGESTNNDGVTISKTIDGTDVENVFDITLQVTTRTSISELLKEPDMAIVLVMDISNTMRQTMGTSTYATETGISDTSRYTAVMGAAENFLDTFAENTNGTSKVGFVAFNTNSTEILPLSSCADQDEADSLKTVIRIETTAILGADNYSSSNSRYTNMEAGLKRARDMLASATNQNKYIIFLTDGMPTTYLQSGYTGYEPVSSSGTAGKDGVFYDNATGYYCRYGTNYSDKAAIRAREMATSIKEQGIIIFSIGADVGTNTIKGYERTGLSTIDRTCSAANKTKDSSYELGSYDDEVAFENWLKGTANGADSTGIGSGYYYSATDKSGLENAYADIFEKIQEINAANAETQWVATDPMSTITSDGMINTIMEFLGFYDINGNYLVYEPTASLSGEDGEGKENTAEYTDSSCSISWDLKKSGYTSTVDGNTTTYTYTLIYRVRLKNETGSFVSENTYDTNGKTFLTYELVTTASGTTTREQKTIDFKIPSVQGYLGSFEFSKVDDGGNPVAEAEFILTHDTTTCSVCRGDELNSVDIDNITAKSGLDGTVSFGNIPSGHTYTLKETSAPSGYLKDDADYTVTVEMGNISTSLTQDRVVNTKTTSVSVTKVWDDNDNVYQIRPSSIKVTLYDGNGDVVTTDASNTAISNPATLSSGSWTKTWVNLNAYDQNGKEIAYTVQENPASWLYSDSDNTDGWYTGETTGTASSGYTITNTCIYTPIQTDITVHKEWDDEDNWFNLRPAEITVTLKQETDGSAEVIGSVTLSQSDADLNGYWSYTWVDLPKYYFTEDSDGEIMKKEYGYTVEENTDFSNHEYYYSPEITEDGSILTITNKLISAKMQLKKIVVDSENNELTTRDPYEFQIRLTDSNGQIFKTLELTDGEESEVILFAMTEDDIQNGFTYTIEETVPREYYLIDMDGEEMTDSSAAYYIKDSVFSLARDINGSTITVYPGDYAYVTLTNQLRDTVEIQIEKAVDTLLESSTFLFRVESDDGVVYYVPVTLDSTGNGTASIFVCEGYTYTIDEISVSRYQLTETTGTDNVAISGDSAQADMNNEDYALVSFSNTLTNYGKVSHSSLVTNHIGN